MTLRNRVLTGTSDSGIYENISKPRPTGAAFCVRSYTRQMKNRSLDKGRQADAYGLTPKMLDAGSRELRAAAYDFWESSSPEQVEHLLTKVWIAMKSASENGDTQSG